MQGKAPAAETDPALGGISEVIRKAKGGSLDHLRQLGGHVKLQYAEHNAEILDSILQHLRVPSHGGDSEEHEEFAALQHASLAIVSIVGLIEVIRWVKRQERRTPVTVSTSLRLFSASQDFIPCILHILTTAATASGINIHHLHHTVVTFFFLLFDVNPRLLSTVASSSAMLDVALVLWTTTYRNLPILYPLGKRPGSDPFVEEIGDGTLSLLDKLTTQNPRGIVNAILEGRACDAETFLAIAVKRMQCLECPQQVSTLSHVEGPRVEIANARFIIRSVDSVLGLEPQLKRGFLERSRNPETFIRALAMMCKWLEECDFPRGLQDRKERVRQILEVLDLAEFVVNWAATSSTNVIHNMRRMIDSGAIHIVATAIPFVVDQRYSKVDTILETVIPYALYRHTMRIWIRAMSQMVTPQLLKTPDTSYRKGTVGTSVTHLHHYREFLDDGVQHSLCDNLKHRAHVARGAAQRSFTERPCGACKTLVYCSERCQYEDWKAFHRLECTTMARAYHEQCSTRSHYHYRHRKLHTNILRHGFESKELMYRCMFPAFPGQMGARMDPSKVQTQVGLLWEDPDANEVSSEKSVGDYMKDAGSLIPPHIRPRFDNLLSTFRRWAIRAGRFGGERGNAVGSLRFMERVFRFGEVDCMIVLLLEQVKPLKTVDGTLMEKDKKVSEFFRRGAKAETSYVILGSLMYQTPRREYRAPRVEAIDSLMESVGQWHGLKGNVLRV